MQLDLEQENKQITREHILKFEKIMLNQPNADINAVESCPLKHYFADGMYIREIFMPKGTIIVSKIHKKKHPYFVLSGRAEVITEKEVVLIEAPYHSLTEPGTKRVLRILENMIWVTVHATKETDLNIIENEIIAKSFDELEDINNSINKIDQPN